MHGGGLRSIKVYGAGVREVNIVYRAGKLNQSADALSRSPAVDVVPEESGSKAVVAVVQAEEDQSDSISPLLREPHPARLPKNRAEIQSYRRLLPSSRQGRFQWKRNELDLLHSRALSSYWRKTPCTMWTPSWTTADGLQYLVTSSSKFSRKTMPRAWVVTYQDRECMVHLFDTGGGMGCTRTLSALHANAPSVPSLQEPVSPTDPHSTQSQLVDRSRLLELTLWNCRRQRLATAMSLYSRTS